MDIDTLFKNHRANAIKKKREREGKRKKKRNILAAIASVFRAAFRFPLSTRNEFRRLKYTRKRFRTTEIRSIR